MDVKDKLEAIGVKDLSSLSAEQVDILYKDHLKKQKAKSKKTDSSKNKSNNVPKSKPSSDEYIIVLKYANHLLKNMGKSPIDKLEQFVDVPRTDIIKECNKKVLKDMEGDIFGKSLFKRQECNYARKSPTKPLSILKYMVRKIGFTVESAEKRTFNNKVRHTTTLYTIC